MRTHDATNGLLEHKKNRDSHEVHRLVGNANDIFQGLDTYYARYCHTVRSSPSPPLPPSRPFDRAALILQRHNRLIQCDNMCSTRECYRQPHCAMSAAGSSNRDYSLHPPPPPPCDARHCATTDQHITASGHYLLMHSIRILVQTHCTRPET